MTPRNSKGLASGQMKPLVSLVGANPTSGSGDSFLSFLFGIFVRKSRSSGESCIEMASSMLG